MSLIQQALEKTSRSQETRTTTPASVPRIWDRDPMGAALEQELVRVQESHARRRSLYWKMAVSVLISFTVAGFIYFGTRQGPVKIYKGNIYRLTGLTDLGGNAIAIINGRLLSVGDALDGRATVKKIGKGEVLLDVRGKKLKLVLH